MHKRFQRVCFTRPLLFPDAQKITKFLGLYKFISEEDKFSSRFLLNILISWNSLSVEVNWFQSSMTFWVKKLLLMVVLVLCLVSLVLSSELLRFLENPVIKCLTMYIYMSKGLILDRWMETY